MVTTDRLFGISTSLAVKPPCKAVAISDITLSGEQTVNGVAVVSGDRVLVTAQSSAVNNGIYVVSASAWQRAADFDGNRDVGQGTLVVVNRTVGQDYFYQVDTDDPIVIGFSEIEFTLTNAPNVTYDITDAEIAAGVTPVNFHIEPGDIRRYGAILDGATDDTTAAQNWIDVGGRLVGAKGTLKVTDQLDMTVNGTYIDGRGMKIVHDVATIESVIFANELTDIRISNLEIDGKKSLKSGSGVLRAYGIDINGSSRVHITDNYVHDTWEHGIRVGTFDNDDTDETTEVLISRNVVEDCGNAANSRGYGIWTFGLVKRMVISNNIVIDCIAGGISSDETSSGGLQDRTNFDVVMADNFVRVDDTITGSVGMRFEGTARGSITGNVVSEAYFGLILAEGQAQDGLTSHIVVSGNIFRGAFNGARFTNIRDVVVDSNLFELYGASGNAGIDMFSPTDPGPVGEPSDRVTISNNIIKSVRSGIKHGENVSHDGDDTLGLSIIGNQLFYTGADTATSGAWGIYSNGADNSLISNNQAHDFYVGFRSADNATWKGNSAFGSVLYGMQVTGGEGRVIRDNNLGALQIESNLFSVYFIDNIATAVTGTFTTTYRKGNIGPSNFAEIVVAATVIADVASTLNTVSKHAGLVVWDSTNNRYMRASGPAAADPWRALNDPTITVTPS